MDKNSQDEGAITPVNPEKSPVQNTTKKEWTQDEYTLAKLGYKQELLRGLGLFEGWASVLTSMNFVSGIPVLFGWVMYSGGPKAAFANWTMVGGFAAILSLSMAEIAAGFPTAGGIYFWSYRLGGEHWGPFLSWMTAWWNWAGWITVVPAVQQGSTNFLLSALEIQYPNATVLGKGWFAWILTSLGMLVATYPNVHSQRALAIYFRLATGIFFSLLIVYWIWFPVKASGNFQSSAGVFDRFYNGINGGPTKQASDSYCWIVSILFGAWVFFGFDASAHLAEETQNASENVAKSMYLAAFTSWLLSVPTLIMILFCIQDFDAIVNADYSNNWAEFLVQVIGPKGAVAILSLLWIDSTCATASCVMSATRVTYAISRDHVLPFSEYFRKLGKKGRMPVNAAWLVCVLATVLTTPVIGSEVAFEAIASTGTVATMFSYLFPIVARQTIARKTFQPAAWNLGRLSLPLGVISSLYILFICIVLLLPEWYPVTGATLNYAPVMIGAITLISVVGWLFPHYGARHWFKGPQRTISEREVLEGVSVKGEDMS